MRETPLALRALVVRSIERRNAYLAGIINQIGYATANFERVDLFQRNRLP